MARPQEFVGAGAPSAGTNAVQTLTIGGTPTSGTFKLAYKGRATGAITWSATNATLLSNINAALAALSNVGASDLTAAAGSLTAGIGTITITAGAAMAGRPVGAISVASNSLSGTAPTLAVAETTPGVGGTGVNRAAKGDRYTDTTNAKLYICTAVSNGVPTWTVAGTQT